MAKLHKFANELLEEAKHFLEKAGDSNDSEGEKAYLNGALMVGFAACEAHVNAMCDDFLTRDELTAHEKGLLSEKAVKLVNGVFEVQTTLQMQRLEDKVEFLCRRFSVKPIDHNAPYWSKFKTAVRLRNELTHPKAGATPIGQSNVEGALGSIIEIINVMHLSLYSQKTPAYHRKLSSKLKF